MNRIIALVLLTFSAIVFAQAPQIKSGATVYIEPMGGYETYLAAAIAKKQVPLIVVADKDRADYIIRSTVTQTTPSQPTVVVNNTNANGSNVSNRGNGGSLAALIAANNAVSASIAVIDARSSQIVFASSSDRGGLMGTAETCAKHLKEFIKKSEKPKK
jgi:hypothetical protein